MDNIPNLEGLKSGWKFRPFSQSSLQILINREVWFSSYELFNDPFDSTQNLKKIVNDVRELIIKEGGNVKVSIDSPGINAISTAPINGQDFIFSLCGNVNNSLMWSHYAHGHSGLAFGFDFSEDSNFMNKIVVEVEYEKSIEDLLREAEKLHYDYRLNHDETLGLQWEKVKKKMKNLRYLTKSKEWSYEQERRLVLTTGSRQIPKNEKGRLVKYQENSLRYIVFGLKSSKEDKKTIINLLKEYRFDHVSVYEIYADYNKKKLMYRKSG